MRIRADKVGYVMSVVSAIMAGVLSIVHVHWYSLHYADVDWTGNGMLIRTGVIVVAAMSLLGAYCFPRARLVVLLLVVIVCVVEVFAPAMLPARGG